MKTLFYNDKRELVWECTKNAMFEFTNGSTAIRKYGAKLGVLVDEKGNEVDKAQYGPF